jgi:hypothetical protein
MRSWGAPSEDHVEASHVMCNRSCRTWRDSGTSTRPERATHDAFIVDVLLVLKTRTRPRILAEEEEDGPRKIIRVRVGFGMKHRHQCLHCNSIILPVRVRGVMMSSGHDFDAGNNAPIILCHLYTEGHSPA